MKQGLIALGLMMLAGSACAADKICEDLAKAVEFGQKELAAATVADVFDGSSKEPLRVAKQSVALLRIQANIQLMQGSKCALPKEPISATPYTDAALQCEIALSKAQMAKQKDLPEECNRDKWSRYVK